MTATAQRQAEISRALIGFGAELLESPVVPAFDRPDGAKSTMTLSFSDEFLGSALDLTKWRRGDYEKADGYFRDFDAKSQAFYIPEQVFMRDGRAVLQAVKRKTNLVLVTDSQVDPSDPEKKRLLKNRFVRGASEDTYHSTWDLQRSLQYQSGAITTSGDRWGMAGPAGAPPTFSFRYGWYEASIQMPKVGKGLWPAMWTKEVTEANRDELDVVEMVDPARKAVSQNLHWGAKGTNNGWTNYGGLGWPSGVDTSAAFHTYGINWQPDRIEWYFDGRLTQSTADKTKIPTTYQYLLLNLAVGGDWPGYPDTNTPFPAEMLIDWVRVWQ